jgi:hypothetical protein
MRKLDHQKRVLARVLATEELSTAVGQTPATVWTDGTPRKDLTNVDAGDVAGTPPPM